MEIGTSGGRVWAVQSSIDEDLLVVSGDKPSLEVMVTGIELAGNAEGVEHGVSEEQIVYAEGEWNVWVPRQTFAVWVQFEILNYLSYETLDGMFLNLESGDQ